MKRTTILVSVIVAVAFAMGAIAAERSATTKPAERSAEMKVLDRHQGNWRGATTVHKAKWTPKEIRGTSTTSRVPVLGGRFNLDRTEASDGASGLTLATYDVQRKSYRMWWFSSTGQSTEWKGQWDAKTKTMTLHSKNDDGVTAVSKVRHPDDKTAKWTVVARNRSGEIGFSMEGTNTRVKQLPKRKAAPASKPAVRSAEQKVLDVFVGDWKTTAAAPKAVSLTGRSSITRILQGRFIQESNRTSDGATYLRLVTYDVQRKCYRMWYFDSRGGMGESKGEFDAKTRTLTMVSDPDNGLTNTAKVRVVDNDTFEWSSVVRDREGKTVFQVKGKHTRVK